MFTNMLIWCFRFQNKKILMGKKRKHSETEVVASEKKDDTSLERPQRTLLGWKEKKTEAQESEPPTTTAFRNREKVLVTCSRRINFRLRKNTQIPFFFFLGVVV